MPDLVVGALMALSDYPLVCGDDHSIVPSDVEHSPALLVNPDADPLVLLSAAHARLNRIRHALEPYAMMPTPDEAILPDAVSLHGFLTALFHQTEEVAQIMQASVDRLNTQKDTDHP